MKKLVTLLFIIFLLWIATGGYMLSTAHPKAHTVMGSGVLYMSFILMPFFIYYRYKDGKYRKYIIDRDKNKGKKKD